MSANLITPDLTKTYNTAAGGNAENRELPATPGTVHWTADRTKAYRFVQAEDANIAVGNVVCFSADGDTNRYEVTADRAGGTSVNTMPAGVAVTAITDGHYGWIQVYGLGEVAIVTDGGIVQGENMIPHATTDGGVDSAAGTETTQSVLGSALVADTGTALAAGEYVLRCPTDSVDAIA